MYLLPGQITKPPKSFSLYQTIYGIRESADSNSLLTLPQSWGVKLKTIAIQILLNHAIHNKNKDAPGQPQCPYKISF